MKKKPQKLPAYDPAAIEKKWQKKWAASKIYQSKESGKTSDGRSAKNKFYVLDMFPYPSGEGLHVGHPKGYIATDIVSRMKRMQGRSVLHPMGFDAFGLPAENYAIKTKTNPADSVKKNVARYKKQLEILGFDYDWSREINTTDPDYYRWTQWIFLQLWKKGLAYESSEPINWCPSCKTGLANEDVEDGRCERCGTPVEKKPIRQWVLKITDYADRLLKDLDIKLLPNGDFYGIQKNGDPSVVHMNELGPGKVRQDKPFVERNAISAFVEHWDGGKFIVLKWKKVDWMTPITGGIEKGQTAEEAARAEIIQETGYKNLELVKVADKVMHSTFFHVPKDENRIGHFTCFHFKLKNGECSEIAKDEKAIHEITWVERAKVRETITAQAQKIAWALVMDEPIGEGARPLLDWPESIKEAQRNWIGRSEGVTLRFKVKDLDMHFEMYDSIPQTFMAQTFTVIAPEHKALRDLVKGTPQEAAVMQFAEQIKAKKAREGFDHVKDMEGIFTGRYIEYAPAGRLLPIWVASYALADYGSGVVNCSTHDERDYAFAKKYDIPLHPVLFPEDEALADKVRKHEIFYREPNGILAEPPEFRGRRWDEARQGIIDLIVKNGWGTRAVQYKLRDWVFSRQRYWGEPIPLIHCERCGVVPVPEKDLPVKLPKVKSYEPTGTGESPLAAIDSWVNVKCPSCVAAKKKPKYFIFDFDGVLGDTWKAAQKAYVQGGLAENEIAATAIMNAFFDKKPPHARDQVKGPDFAAKSADWNQRFGSAMKDIEFKLFDAFVAEIKKYKGAKFAVVSSGSQKYVRPALKRLGLKLSHALVFEDHHSKEEKIERIAKDWKVSLKDIYYFTDTKADVYELENLLDRRKIIGCAWGYQGAAKLKEVLPERQILADFADIHRLFKHDSSARRETNTMPQWAGSSWYYLRYEDPANKRAVVDPKKEKYWSPVDLYVGGAEHATRHLIYARFWHKFLYDIDVVSGIEPFAKLQSVGLIMGEDGRKMSKRYGNVINPDDIVKTYGADTLRIYEMFMGPFDQQIAWSTTSMIGARRFIERVWKLAEKVSPGAFDENERIIHKTVKKVSEDIESLRFNTAISALMIAVNELDKAAGLTRAQFETMLKLIAPFAPHAAEELWTSLGNKKSVHISAWPIYDPALTLESELTIILQINGKVRGSFKVPVGTGKDELEKLARQAPEASKWLENKEIKRIVVIPDRLVNIVAI